MNSPRTDAFQGRETAEWRDTPVDLAPPVPELASDRVALWVDLMITCEQFLLAELRREIGPDGDLEAAHRKGYEERMRQHNEELIYALQRASRRRSTNG